MGRDCARSSTTAATVNAEKLGGRKTASFHKTPALLLFARVAQIAHTIMRELHLVGTVAQRSRAMATQIRAHRFLVFVDRGILTAFAFCENGVISPCS